MINTDASGQGSLVYGKTSDHVLGVRCCWGRYS
jgi:FAD/FMN-containing dehydrogenase